MLACILLFGGCRLIPGRIHTKTGTNVTTPKNASAATTVQEGTTVETVPIPQGSTVEITKTPAIPATDKTPAEPPKEVTKITFSAPSEKRIETKNTAISLAPPRAPDTSVQIHEADNRERRIFLWAALAFGVATGVLAYLHILGAAKISAIAAGSSIALYIVLGHQELILWVLAGIVVCVVLFVLYTEWRHGKLRSEVSLAVGTVQKLTQSVEEYAKDNPLLGKDLKQNYIATNTDDAHKAVIDVAAKTMDPTYLSKPPDPTFHVVATAPVVVPAPAS